MRCLFAESVLVHGAMLVFVAMRCLWEKSVGGKCFGEGGEGDVIDVRFDGNFSSGGLRRLGSDGFGIVHRLRTIDRF